MRNTARFAVTFSAGALFLQLLALLHPAKPIVDALFHAHRFEDVLAGRLYFTQLSTSATPFPYAIGLYLFAAPWAFLTANHVALLRVVVSTFEVLAGGLLYTVVVKTWGNRLAAAIAVALFILVPRLVRHHRQREPDQRVRPVRVDHHHRRGHHPGEPAPASRWCSPP